MSHVEYAPHALLTLEKDETDRQVNAKHAVTLRLPLDAASVKKSLKIAIFTRI